MRAGLHEALDAAILALDALGEVGVTRGAARDGVVASLAEIDAALLASSRAAADELLPALVDEAEGDLRGFRSRMSSADYDSALDAAVGCLLRRRLKLPTIVFEP